MPLVGEVLALSRVMDVMYVNTTTVRRQVIVRGCHPGEAVGRGEIPGALVQMAQSPFRVMEAFRRGEDALASRAREVIEALGPHTREEWDRIAAATSTVKTTLSALGREVSARLTYQGYVVAMCNLYVLFGGGTSRDWRYRGSGGSSVWWRHLTDPNWAANEHPSARK